MTLHPQRLLWRAGLWLVALLPISTTASQNYPERPITMFVGTSAGGPTDAMARSLARRLQDSLGTNVVVVNRDGASGMLANQATARAAPDGYTIQLGTTSSSILAPMFAQDASFDTADLAAVSLIGATPMVLFTNPQVAASTGQDLVRLLKANPGDYAYATAGVGSTSNVSGELFKRQAGVDMLHVPYKGGGQLNQAVVAGDTQVGINTLGAMIPLHQAGRVRILMVLGDTRSSLAPEIPAAQESGIEGVDSMLNFYLMAHAQTPAPIMEKLSTAMQGIVADPSFSKEAKSAQVEPYPHKSVPEVRSWFAAERDKWSNVTQQMKTHDN